MVYLIITCYVLTSFYLSLKGLNNKVHNTYKRLIMSYLEEMEINLTAINNKENILFQTNINQFIESFVQINNKLIELKVSLKGNFNEINTRLRNLLLEMIEKYNAEQQLSRTLLEKIISEYRIWNELLVGDLKYRVVIFGINTLTPLMDKVIDPNKAEVAYYIDDIGENIGKNLNGKKIIDFGEIINVPFDYMFNISPHDKIVNQLKQSSYLGNESFIDYLFYKQFIISSPEFFIKQSNFLSGEKNYSGILTGLSYVQKGVNEKKLKGNFLNLANPSQDLFYDFEMFKYAYDFPEIKENLKYTIIGLSYYSFHFDLSKSVHQNRVNYYYPFVKTMHNNSNTQNYMAHHQKLKELEDKLLYYNHLLEIFESEKAFFQEIIDKGYEKEYNCIIRTEVEILEDVRAIKRDFNKNYPLTVDENKEILKQFLRFLKEKGIKPIIIVCPVTKLYQAFTPNHFKQDFYEIIEKIGLEYPFQFLDYYSSSEFSDSDFYDHSHMNKKGSQKFTELLNQDIEW